VLLTSELACFTFLICVLQKEGAIVSAFILAFPHLPL